MAKKAIKLDDIAELVEDSIEKKLDVTIERIIIKLIPTIDKIVKDLLTPQLDLVKKNQTQLHVDNAQLRSRLDQIETEIRLNSLLLHGLAETSTFTGSNSSSENEPIRASLDLFNNTLGLQILEADIVHAYRLQKRGKDQHRPILIKFDSRGLRNRIYGARLKLRNTQIYINEHLTAQNAQIFAKTRALKKSGKVSSSWTMGGYIYVKLSSDPGTKINRIRDLQDLNTLLPGMDFSSSGSLPVIHGT